MMNQPSRPTNILQNKSVVLYVKQNDVNSALAIQLASQRPDVHIQNINALPKQNIPRWLNVVPTCVILATKEVYKGKQAIDLLRQRPPSHPSAGPPMTSPMAPPMAQPMTQPMAPGNNSFAMSNAMGGAMGRPQYPSSSYNHQFRNPSYQNAPPLMNNAPPTSNDDLQPSHMGVNSLGCAVINQDTFAPMFTPEQEEQINSMNDSQPLNIQSVEQYKQIREKQLQTIAQSLRGGKQPMQ